MIKRDLELNAVLDRDLRSLIDEYGLGTALDAGELRCPECDRMITFENIGALRVVYDSAIIICDDYACIAEVED